MEVFQALKLARRSPWRLIVPLFLGLLLITGCEREEPTPQATAVPTPTTAAISPTSLPAKTNTATPPPTANFKGIRFVYDSDLVGVLNQPQSHTVRPPGQNVSQGLPESIHFTFGPQNHDTEFSPHNSQLFVFPLEHYATMSNAAEKRIKALQQLITSRQLEVDTPLPLLPLPTGSETFHSHPKLIEFENGFGISYITQYDLEPNFITNENIFYTFQGISEDGKFYISAFFPVDNADLPANQNDSDSSVFQDVKFWETYRSKTVSDLNAASADEYNPNLDILDRMMASLQVTPEDSFPTELMQEYAYFPGVMLGYNPSLIEKVKTESIPAYFQAENQPPMMLTGVPDTIRFLLEPHGGQQIRPSTLTINPIRDSDGNFFAALPESFTQNINDLETRLGAAESQPKPGQTHLHRLNFQSGIGIRALVYQPQDGATPVHYNFEGVTHDGRYYVNYDQSLEAPAFQGATEEPDLETLTTLLQNQAITTFSPDINALDRMLQSLAVAADASTTSSIPENPADCQNEADFIGDVNFPDDEIIERGDTFTKIWRVRNSGDCTWTPAYQVVFDEGNLLEWQQHELLNITPPGSTADISVTLISPEEAGSYQTWFRLADETGTPFDKRFYVQFEAPEPAQTLPDFGVIEGSISFPAGTPPALTIYFLRTDGNERYALETESGWTRYVNSIPIGHYFVFARVTGDKSNFGGGFTRAVECGLTANCNDHDLIPVEIEDGKTARGIDITDWYAPAGTFPLSSD